MIVITMTNCPPKLRGDLSKWFCEINTGVYVGQVSARVRDALWERVCEHIHDGQATMVYPMNNEQHMAFRTHNSDWVPTDYDGITLMKRPVQGSVGGAAEELHAGFSKASGRQIAKRKQRQQQSEATRYAFFDLETSGLQPNQDLILEIGVVLVSQGVTEQTWQTLIRVQQPIPPSITALTGITDAMCQEEGVELCEALETLRELVINREVVAYHAPFDMSFLQAASRLCGVPMPIRRCTDLLPLVKRRIVLPNYRLETVAKELAVDGELGVHRALADSFVLRDLFFKLNES